MPHDHDLGLSHDLPHLLSRRRALGLMAGGLSSLALAACGSDDRRSPGATARTATTTGTAEIPEETAGPYPGDGSNGPNVLAESGVVRRDITTSLGGASGVAAGVPLAIELTLIDVAAGGAPLAGAAVYLWHCTRDGQYSMYDADVADESFLRGVQASHGDGRLSFASVFPGAYAGRWPHIHFEVYESVAAATAAGAKLKTSQIALPAELCEQVYATEGYEQSARNLSGSSLDGDMVFADGYAGQLATASGTPGDGLAIRLDVGV